MRVAPEAPVGKCWVVSERKCDVQVGVYMVAKGERVDLVLGDAMKDAAGLLGALGRVLGEVAGHAAALVRVEVAHVEPLHDAYDWLIAQGITDQWTEPFPRESLEHLIERGEVYVVSHAGAIIATFTLTYQADPELWDDPPDDAGYIRRLVVDRAHAGHNIGGQLLDHAGSLVAATGREWLRLDCAKHNTRLHDYYRSRGFDHLGTIDLPHRQSGALFQRRAALVAPRRAPNLTRVVVRPLRAI
jgi:ribosomal protein S18 acetylase RimI-like enzyme